MTRRAQAEASAGPAFASEIPPADHVVVHKAEHKLYLYSGTRLLGEYKDVPVHWRDALKPGSRIAGPAIIAEAQTATVVSAVFDAHIDRFGNIVLERRHDA